MTSVAWPRIFYAAACVAWAMPGIVAIAEQRIGGWRAVAWAGGALVFAALFRTSPEAGSSSPPRAAPLARLAVLTSAAAVMVVAAVDISRYASAVAFVLIAQQLAWCAPRRVASLWIAAQSVVALAVFWRSDGWLVSVSAGGLLVALQYYVLGRALLVVRERQAREALQRANAELEATRELLAARSREAERLRIARDLHDTLGHHLTALSIQLEVASRQSAGPAAGHLREAHAIARLLLAEVRDVVGRLRDPAPIDVADELRLLAGASRRPCVHVTAPPALAIDDAAQAEALLRCAQEIVTNAARHADADNVWIEIAERDDGLEIRARDDGRGAAELVCGHGLAGMQERFESVAGSVEFDTSLGKGFAVTGFMPRRAEAAQ